MERTHRPKSSSPVDSVLKPDLRFPQGDAEAGVRLAEVRDDEDKRRRERSKSVGARPSPNASPSLEDVEELRALTQELKLPWPVAPAPSLVEAYGGLREGLKVLRISCIHFGKLAREVSGGELFRQMLRSAVSAQVFGGYVVHTYVLFSSLYWQLSSGKSAMSGRSDLQVCHRKLAAGPRRAEHVCATEMRVLLSR